MGSQLMDWSHKKRVLRLKESFRALLAQTRFPPVFSYQLYEPYNTVYYVKSGTNPARFQDDNEVSHL